ncbi:MAG TPA: hypothetical protein PKB15_00435 [Acidimicrobiia bacterium]|nr:hypothetical protein [Acidimicrobiia bacterium]
MSTRYSFLASSIAVVTLCFFAANQSTQIGVYGVAGLTCAIIACSMSTLSLALYTLKSMSILYITRAITPALLIVVLFSQPPIFVTLALVSTMLLHLCFFSEVLLSRATRTLGSANEDMFILRAPLSVALWFFFTWSVVWATLIECIHLFGSDRTILGIVAFAVALFISILFFASQLRILLRRCVIVPHGIVASDPIALTDVVLLPLSKIASVEFIKKISSDYAIPESTFAALSSSRNIVAINLNESTDSLIARKGVNETERRNVNRILFCVADAQGFVKQFHKRFHKMDSEPLTPSQEKMVEKELGIETAPRSDAKLPQHRKKKK